MSDKHGLNITSRDRVLRSWQESMEAVMRYQEYMRDTENDEEISAVFAEFSEDEGMHASKFLEIVRELDKEQ